MNTTVPRNQPCPCGSGRKYKHCCYRRDASASAGSNRFPDPEWNRIRRTEGESVNAIASFARNRFSADLVQRAMLEFSDGCPIPIEQIVESIFLPWFVFNWIPWPSVRLKSLTGPVKEPLGLTYLAEHGSNLDDYQKSFIRAACGEPFSFFLVTGVEPRRSLALRDLLLERELTIKERQATESLTRGSIIYARTVSLAGQSILLGVGPVILPPEFQIHILDLREAASRLAGKKGVINPDFLRSQDSDLRSFYFEAADQVMNPPPPVLQNTDGESLVPIRLHYELRCNPNRAFEKLKTLALPEFQEGLLEDADFDGSGKLVRVSLQWQKKGNAKHAGWDNTVLGNIEIDHGRLVVEVNSEKRADRIRRELHRRLRDECVFVNEKRESIETMLKGRMARGGRRKVGRRGAREEESMPPELRAALKESMKAHWNAWLDTPIPALKNRSPREAAGTKEGRERLEALLMEFECRDQSLIKPELRPDIAELRKKLGLT